MAKNKPPKTLSRREINRLLAEGRELAKIVRKQMRPLFDAPPHLRLKS